MTSLLAATIGLCIAYTAFCRARVMTASTEPAIRYLFAAAGMCGMGVAAGEAVVCLGLDAAHWAWWVPYRWHALGLSFAAVQFVTSRYWGTQPPKQFQRQPVVSYGRRQGDVTTC